MHQSTHARMADGTEIKMRRNTANGTVTAILPGRTWIEDITDALLWLNREDATQLWLAQEGAGGAGGTGTTVVFLDADADNLAKVERFLKEVAHAGPGSHQDLGLNVKVRTD